MPLKRILLIISFLVVTFGLGVAIYFVFFRAPKPPEKPGVPIVTPGELPTAGVRVPGIPEAPEAPTGLPLASPVAQGGVTQTKTLVSGDLAGITGRGDDLQYYNRGDGKFYRVNSDGRIEEVSSRAFFNVDKVTWTPNREAAVLEYPDGSNIFYDFGGGKQATLPKHWEEFDFSPQGDKVSGLSMGIDPANRWLFTSNPDGTAAKIIEALGENADKVQVAWSPSGQVIAFSNTGEPKGFGREQILLIGQNHENFKGLIVEGLGFDGRWSPDGSRVLYSVASPSADMRPTLWIVNGQGEAIGTNRRNLGLNTWVDKCAFSEAAAVYCAVPTNLPEGAGLERGITKFTPDNFYKLNLSSGAKTLVAVPEVPVNATNLSVSQDGATLYFQDSISGNILTLRLK